MNANSQRECCFKLLDKVLNGNVSVTDVLASIGCDAADFVTAAVYGTISYLHSIDFMVKLASGKEVADMDSRTATIIRFGAWQILFSKKVPDYAAVDSSVKLANKYSRSSSGFVNAVLRKVAALSPDKRDISNYRPNIATSLSSEVYGVIKRSYGARRALSIGRAFLEAPELTVRYNPSRISRDELVHMLERDDFQVKGSHFMPEALILDPGQIPLNKSEAFTKGLFFVQSESAMLASHVADPKPGQKILDCCSAPGGKSTHMAELSEDKASITALDKSPERIKKICENTRRLGLDSISCEPCDSTKYSAIEMYDTVLADVPCSGLGLLSKKPEIRVRLDYQRIIELIPIQRQILNNISSCVKPGGTLVYSTCSINKAENEEQIEAFLSSHSDFYADDITPFIPEKLIIDEDRSEQARNGTITLLPDTDKSDGFFIARLKRRA